MCKQYALSSITIMFYLEDIVVQKEDNLFNLVAFCPKDHIYIIWPLYLTYNNYNR